MVSLGCHESTAVLVSTGGHDENKMTVMKQGQVCCGESSVTLVRLGHMW